MSCTRTQEFLAKTGVVSPEVVDAKTKVLGADDVRALLKDVDHVYVAKGKKVAHFDLKTTPTAEVIPSMLGPTGNLRAPTLRKGRTLIVGFEQGMYQNLLG